MFPELTTERQNFLYSGSVGRVGGKDVLGRCACVPVASDPH